MYAVVVFSDNSIEVVPTSWLRGDSKFRWPPRNSFKASSLSKAVSTGVPPSPEWETHDVKVLAETGNGFPVHTPVIFKTLKYKQK